MDHLNGVHSTLAEYTSRKARYNLVLLCLDHLKENEKKSHVSATQALADRLSVSHRTVQRWESSGIQSCNVNAEAIINTSLNLTPEKASETLRGDLLEHKRQLHTTTRVEEDPKAYANELKNQETEETKQLKTQRRSHQTRYRATNPIDRCPPAFTQDCVLMDDTKCPYYHNGRCIKEKTT